MHGEHCRSVPLLLRPWFTLFSLIRQHERGNREWRERPTHMGRTRMDGDFGGSHHGT